MQISQVTVNWRAFWMRIKLTCLTSNVQVPDPPAGGRRRSRERLNKRKKSWTGSPNSGLESASLRLPSSFAFTKNRVPLLVRSIYQRIKWAATAPRILNVSMKRAQQTKNRKINKTKQKTVFWTVMWASRSPTSQKRMSVVLAFHDTASLHVRSFTLVRTTRPAGQENSLEYTLRGSWGKWEDQAGKLETASQKKNKETKKRNSKTQICLCFTWLVTFIHGRS